MALDPTPELTFLLECLGPPQPRPLAPAPPCDWTQLQHQAQRHHLGGYLAWRMLVPPQPCLPNSATEAFRASLRQATVRNLYQLQQLRQCLVLLEAACVDALPFKGAFLNAIAYPHLGSRESVDLDILVRPDAVGRAFTVLCKDGFRPRETKAATHLERFTRHEMGLEFHHPGRGIALDLHWRAAPQWFSVSFDLGALWTSCRTADVAGAPLPCITSTNHVLLLLLHGARHQWNNAVWVLDLAMLLRDASVEEWQALLHLAQDLHLERMLRVALRLVAALGWPLPETAARFTNVADRAAMALVTEVLRSWSRPEEREHFSSPVFRNHWRMRERFRDRLALAWRLLFRLTPRDWNRVTLPASLDWFYLPLRATRLVTVYLPRLWR
ncbi:MAG: nucleotidyltransferase domain-containing protein [Terriglobales bacterium]